MSQSARSRGPYAKSAARRRQILAAALDAFGELGYNGASLNEIARRSGLTNAGLAHHFASKEELLEAVLHERDDDQRLSSARWEGTYPDRLRDVVARNAADRDTVQLYSSMSTSATESRHPAHEYFVTRYESFRASMTTQIELAQERGDIRDDINSEILASMILAVMDGLQLQWLLEDSIDMNTIFESFVTLIERR